MHPLSNSSTIYYEDLCNVCLMNYEKRNIPNKCYLLACGHIFHEKCLNPWLQQQSNCPKCKKESFIYLSPKERLKEASVKGIECYKKICCGIGVTAASVILINTFIYSFAYDKEVEAYRDKNSPRSLENAEIIIVTAPLAALVLIAGSCLFYNRDYWLNGKKKSVSSMARKINLYIAEPSSKSANLIYKID